MHRNRKPKIETQGPGSPWEAARQAAEATLAALAALTPPVFDQGDQADREALVDAQAHAQAALRCLQGVRPGRNPAGPAPAARLDDLDMVLDHDLDLND